MKIMEIKNRKTSMWHKLLLYMLTLAVVVVIFVGVGLFIVGQFSTTTEKYSNNLSLQYEFYSRQLDKYFDDLSMLSDMLSANTSEIVTDYLSQKGITLTDFNNSQDHTEGVQLLLFPKLQEILLKTDASGAFFLLDATRNTHSPTRLTRKRVFTFNAVLTEQMNNYSF